MATAAATQHDTDSTTPSIDQFWKDGVAFIKAMKETGADPCQAIQPGTKEWGEWGAYFLERYGEVPKSFRMVERRQLDSFTVPARWPQWFDKRWAPDVVRYVPRKPARSQPSAADAEALRLFNERWAKFERENPAAAHRMRGGAFSKTAEAL